MGSYSIIYCHLVVWSTCCLLLYHVRGDTMTNDLLWTGPIIICSNILFVDCSLKNLTGHEEDQVVSMCMLCVTWGTDKDSPEVEYVEIWRCREDLGFSTRHCWAWSISWLTQLRLQEKICKCRWSAEWQEEFHAALRWFCSTCSWRLHI